MLKHRIVSGNHWPRPAKPTRWICTDEPVTCRRCHIEWLDGDPALSVECSGCGAEAGYPCQRPQGEMNASVSSVTVRLFVMVC